LSTSPGNNKLQDLEKLKALILELLRGVLKVSIGMSEMSVMTGFSELPKTCEREQPHNHIFQEHEFAKLNADFPEIFVCSK
jgi:hypothetical protein